MDLILLYMFIGGLDQLLYVQSMQVVTSNLVSDNVYPGIDKAFGFISATVRYGRFKRKW